jgi:hypothetical protein
LIVRRDALAGLLCSAVLAFHDFAANSETRPQSSDRVFAHFRETLSRPAGIRLRVISVEPGDGGGVIWEFPPRKGVEVEKFAALTCELPLTAEYRSELADRIAQTRVQPRSDRYPPALDWGLELRDSNGRLQSAIYMATDWTNRDFTQAEIDGAEVDVSKALVKWIEARFPVKDCWFKGGPPATIHTFQYYQDRIGAVR